MRLFCLCNGQLGLDITTWLVHEGENIVGVAIHPEERSRRSAEIVAASRVPPERVFDGSRLADPIVVDAVRALEPEIGVSILFGYILRAPFLSLFPRGLVNLHTAYLPYNRGAYPNVWSIVEGTPAGATLHYVDEGVDTGDIVAQAGVAVSPADTGATLYHKLEDAASALFRETWPRLRAAQAARIPQPPGGTSHRVADVARIDEIDLEKSYRARDLIDILRARTCPPHKGAYFDAGGRRYYLSVELTESEEAD